MLSRHVVPPFSDLEGNSSDGLNKNHRLAHVAQRWKNCFFFVKLPQLRGNVWNQSTACVTRRETEAGLMVSTWWKDEHHHWLAAGVNKNGVIYQPWLMIFWRNWRCVRTQRKWLTRARWCQRSTSDCEVASSFSVIYCKIDWRYWLVCHLIKRGQPVGGKVPTFSRRRRRRSDSAPRGRE